METAAWRKPSWHALCPHDDLLGIIFVLKQITTELKHQS